jgi:anaerobic selenocysteine-containing dehydrogenase
MQDPNPQEWKSTACILCSANCGIKVQLSEDGQTIARTKGDDEHPGSRGYVCNKASRLNYYQNRADRLVTPMRRTPDGGYEAIDWSTAVEEIAAKFKQVRDSYGGDKIFYYGGGGQGNHLPGGYSRTFTLPLGVKYRSNALAQEKTGEFWVAERMFGGWPHGDFEHAQVAIFLGKNPWHSHGIQRARAAIREMAKDPDRTLIVIDPKRTETADLADIHLPVRPAADAWLLAGLVATLVQEELLDHAWLEEHAVDIDPILAVFAKTDIADCAAKSGIDEAVVRSTTRLIAGAESVALLEDLGVQMNRHSTVVSYLQRLLWTLTGNFAKPGTHYLASSLANIGGGRETGVSPVVGARMIDGLVPCNVIPDEVLADHPARYRAMIIESANPVHSLADTPKWREAMRALDVSVVIDVAMTETAREADYVLPATSQYEKVEATFFNFEFPQNYFHVRHPIFTPPPGTLDEAEIHMRLAQAIGAIPAGLENELAGALEEGGREALAALVFAKLSEDPSLAHIAPGLLYRTLGKSLPKDLQNAAAVWALCHEFAVAHRQAVLATGLTGDGMALGESLFDALLSHPSGTVITNEAWEDVWRKVPNGKLNLVLDDMLAVAVTLNESAPVEATSEFPFLLAAGERRAYTANTILRDPDWRKKDRAGALLINPEDAARINLGEGSTAKVTTERGSANVVVELSDRMFRGHVSLPNGMGLDYPDGETGKPSRVGIALNELTSTGLRDEFVGTPWHKSVPARVEAVD